MKDRHYNEPNKAERRFDEGRVVLNIAIGLGIAAVAVRVGGGGGEHDLPDTNYPLANDQVIQMATPVAYATPEIGSALHGVENFGVHVSDEAGIYTLDDGTEFYIDTLHS